MISDTVWEEEERRMRSLIECKYRSGSPLHPESQLIHIIDDLVSTARGRGVVFTLKHIVCTVLRRLFSNLVYGYPWEFSRRRISRGIGVAPIHLTADDNPDVSVVVMFNRYDCMESCLRRLSEYSDDIRRGVHVVAPARAHSLIRSLLKNPDCILFHTNLEGACNLVEGKATLFLSDEFKIHDGCMGYMMRTMSEQHADAVCPNLLNADGTVLCSGEFIGSDGSVVDYGSMLPGDSLETAYVKRVQMAHPGCILLSRRCLDAVRASSSRYDAWRTAMIDFEYGMIERGGLIMNQPRAEARSSSSRGPVCWYDIRVDGMDFVSKEHADLLSGLVQDACEYFQRDSSMEKTCILILFRSLDMELTESILKTHPMDAYKITIYYDDVRESVEGSQSLMDRGIEILNPHTPGYDSWMRKHLLFVDEIIVIGDIGERLERLIVESNANIIHYFGGCR